MNISPKLLRAEILADVRTAPPIKPRCSHAPPNDRCGGCAFQDRSYEAQIAAKHAALRRVWAELLTAEQVDTIGFVASPNPFAYRTRMDYVASRGRFGLRRGGKFNHIIDLSECHLIPPAAFTVARAVYQAAIELEMPDYDLRSHEGFLRYITVRRSPDDQLLLVIVTAAQERADEMARLAKFALSHDAVVGVHWLVNPAVTDLAAGEPIAHWGAATLPMRVGPNVLQIGPGTFFQNNVHLLLPLLNAVKAAVGTESPAVADLYGGVGTIALHLAPDAASVVCVEAFGESAALARSNVADNNASNVTVVAADVAPYLQHLASAPFTVAVADPPRAGLGPEVCRELLRLGPQRIVYVSCNPLTMIEDARALLTGYTLVSLDGYDMFPQTPHLEALGVFDRQP